MFPASVGTIQPFINGIRKSKINIPGSTPSTLEDRRGFIQAQGSSEVLT